ncbi:MAG: hypothetical protein MR779_04650 [Tenericutes bacterium]|nr:hypothetical protein [Mycoplasmatota bacterium]
MRKKRRLTKFGKRIVIFIILIITTLLFILVNKGLNNYNELANKCDLTKGYTCSLYEIKNFNE